MNHLGPLVATSLTVLAATTFSLNCTNSDAKEAHRNAEPAKRFELNGCDAPKPAKAEKKDTRIRGAAQRGLDFLGESTLAWQETNNCMGCHVQGVTGEALSVGMHHQYEVKPNIMSGVLTGLLDLPGGIRTTEGHTALNANLRASSRAYSGAAIARYDEWVKDDLSDDLLTAAHDLLPLQAEDGGFPTAHNNAPVSRGSLQGTYQAIQTWQQAYARSADDRWLTAISSGERYIQNVVDSWYQNPPSDVQALNYALLGLLEAGVSPSEHVAIDLKNRILWLQNEDGGWGFGQVLGTEYNVGLGAPGADKIMGSGESVTLATGQAIYTLKTLGMTDADSVVQKGTHWILEHQQESGGWSSSGSERGEAMWAVLGLVSTDVLTIDLAGVRSGQHVANTHKLNIVAKDNSGVGVLKVEVKVDDVPIAGSCSDKVNFAWDTKDLADGIHQLQVTATTKSGQESSRHWTVYAGNTYLTNVGTKFEGGETKISYRDIAEEEMARTVKVQIFSTKEADGVTVRDKLVFTQNQQGKQGGSSVQWVGTDQSGKSLKPGDYIAVLEFQDVGGKTRQTIETPFVHDTPENQRQGWGDVAGKVDLAGADVQGAQLELVDEKGNVVQRVSSTKSGNYRFKNAKADRKYKVRVKRKGFEDMEKTVAPVAAAAASMDAPAADFSLQVK